MLGNIFFLYFLYNICSVSLKPDYEALKEHCNLWRNYDDIDDSFESVAKIMDYFSKNQDRIQPHGGPGHWNDPDMVCCVDIAAGDISLTYIFSYFTVDSWQFWFELRSEQIANGCVGHFGRAIDYVKRFGYSASRN